MREERKWGGVDPSPPPACVVGDLFQPGHLKYLALSTAWANHWVSLLRSKTYNTDFKFYKPVNNDRETAAVLRYVPVQHQYDDSGSILYMVWYCGTWYCVIGVA